MTTVTTVTTGAVETVEMETVEMETVETAVTVTETTTMETTAEMETIAEMDDVPLISDIHSGDVTQTSMRHREPLNDIVPSDIAQLALHITNSIVGTQLNLYLNNISGIVDICCQYAGDFFVLFRSLITK